MSHYQDFRRNSIYTAPAKATNRFIKFLKTSWRLIFGISFLISLLVNIILVTLTVLFLTSPDLQEIVTCDNYSIKAAADKTVYIEGEEGTGSGFWIQPNIVLTNNHVVNYNEGLKVLDENNVKHDAKVIATDTVRDLALLEIDGYTGTPLEWSDGTIDIADRVYAIGYPGYGNLTVTEGIVSSFMDDPYNDRTYIQTDSAINPGNSGGPLVDQCGKVVGVNTFTLDAENIGFAIDAEQVKNRANELIEASRKATPEERIYSYPSEQAEVVAKYYDLLYSGELEKAFDYYSVARKARLPFENWKKGFDHTVFIDFKSVSATSTPNVVKVNFITTERDLETFDFITKEFEGEWTLVRENNIWKMDQSNIKDITKPQE